MATLAGCEMGLKLAGVPVAASGVAAAMDSLMSSKRPVQKQAA
jgi:alanine-glyoxylate transaminase/serine-glyoxylate transaminase/serine-pyruvate transaminase